MSEQATNEKVKPTTAGTSLSQTQKSMGEVSLTVSKSATIHISKETLKEQNIALDQKEKVNPIDKTDTPLLATIPESDSPESHQEKPKPSETTAKENSDSPIEKSAETKRPDTAEEKRPETEEAKGSETEEAKRPETEEAKSTETEGTGVEKLETSADEEDDWEKDGFVQVDITTCLDRYGFVVFAPAGATSPIPETYVLAFNCLHCSLLRDLQFSDKLLF